jgi:hypothetical protein
VLFVKKEIQVLADRGTLTMIIDVVLRKIDLAGNVLEGYFVIIAI